LSTAPDQPILCYVTDRKALGASEPVAQVVNCIRAALAAGVEWVHIREKDLTARALLDLSRKAVSAAAEHRGNCRARVVVNDRVDIALVAGAQGVHLGHVSMPAREVIRWCRTGNAPADFTVGVSCHSLEQAREAEKDGASYVFFGPIFETPAKIRFGQPQGIAKLAGVCREVHIPVIAIGGVNEENAGECIRAGAAGIAAIRLFQEPRIAGELKNGIRRIRGGRV
jgi:thiamine-phosphate pyrophosphorylase